MKIKSLLIYAMFFSYLNSLEALASINSFNTLRTLSIKTALTTATIVSCFFTCKSFIKFRNHCNKAWKIREALEKMEAQFDTSFTNLNLEYEYNRSLTFIRFNRDKNYSEEEKKSFIEYAEDYSQERQNANWYWFLFECNSMITPIACALLYDKWPS